MEGALLSSLVLLALAFDAMLLRRSEGSADSDEAVSRDLRLCHDLGGLLFVGVLATCGVLAFRGPAVRGITVFSDGILVSDGDFGLLAR